MSANLPDTPTGEQLYDELCRAAGAAGRSLSAFAAPLFASSWKIEQLRIARRPKPETVARVRALCSGRLGAVTRKRYFRDERAAGLSRLQAEALGIPPSMRSLREQRVLEAQAERRAGIEELRRLSEVAKATRKPGQPLGERLRELRRGVPA